MNNGYYNGVNSDIVRLVYLDTTPSPPESSEGDGTNNNGDNDSTDTSRDLKVGLFVGLFGVAAIVVGVLYRTRQNRHVEDDGDMHTINEASGLQSPLHAQSQSIDGVGTTSFEDPSGMLSTPYDESGMVMADTAMDSVSSDGLGIAT